MRGIVPDFILDNDRKVGLNASLEELMDFSSQETKEFFDQESSIYEIVKKEKIMELISKKDLPNSFSKFLFNFINAKIFLDQQNL